MKKQISACINCKYCVSYIDPEEVDNGKFHIMGYDKGVDLYKEPGAFCGVAGITIKMNVQKCEMHERKKKRNDLFTNIFKFFN